MRAAAKRAAIKHGLDKDDLEQDLMLKLLEMEQGLSDQALSKRFNPQYIYTMAYNRAFDLRRNARAELADLSETAEDPEELGATITETTDGSIGNPEHEAIMSESMAYARQHVLGLVNLIQEPFRAVVKAYYLQGLDYQGIATHQGLPINTVKSRLKRARDSLGGSESALRAWREYAYPGARQPNLG